MFLTHIQKFMTPDGTEITKDEIAMIWAPIVLRNPSDDNNVYQETAVMKCLLDTNESSHSSP